MLKIAICDDEPVALTFMTFLLSRFGTDNNVLMSVDPFRGGAELLDSLRTKSYDLLILDILMPGLNGMETAQEIRGTDPETPIIFLTGSADFAVESYSVGAFSYLLKPVTADALYPVLRRILHQKLRKEETLTLSLPTGIVRLPFSTIEFLEVNRRRLRFNLEDDTVRELGGTLAQYEPLFLARGEFIKVHRSFILNLSHVRELTAAEALTYAGRTVPISRLLSAQVRARYAAFTSGRHRDEET